MQLANPIPIFLISALFLYPFNVHAVDDARGQGVGTLVRLEVSHSIATLHYRATLFKNGTAEYEGGVNVKTRGKVRYELPQATVSAIYERLRRVRPEDADFRGILTAPSGEITYDLSGTVKTILVGRSQLNILELFRDLQLLLDTEKFRCPFKFEDYGPPLGQLDQCKYKEVVLSLQIEDAKKYQQINKSDK